MTTTDPIEEGLARLTAILPLAPRREALDAETGAVHRTVLEAYLDEGAAPTIDRLRGTLPDVDVVASLDRLARLDLVVVSDGRIVGAYPFRSDGASYRVEVGGVETTAMCSLDALAIGAVTELATTIRSRCALTGTPIVIEMAEGEATSADPPSPMVGIRWQDTGGCAAATLCREMVFLADEAAADRWAEAGSEAGRYHLADAVVIARRFFRPVLAPALSARGAAPPRSRRASAPRRSTRRD